MREMISLFVRERKGSQFLATEEVTEGAEWVIAGEGVATRKWDGTCCRVLGGVLYRRHRVKEGKTAPPGWMHWSDDVERLSGHGWVPVSDHAGDQYHREAFGVTLEDGPLPDGTYELLGPKVQKNVEEMSHHVLMRHGTRHGIKKGDPRTRAALKDYLGGCGMEGIVWHHDDGRMVKVKCRDFGVIR